MGALLTGGMGALLTRATRAALQGSTTTRRSLMLRQQQTREKTLMMHHPTHATPNALAFSLAHPHASNLHMLAAAPLFYPSEI